MLTPAATRYLLAIYRLGEGIRAVRSVDIANNLSVTRASVVKMLSLLSRDGLILKEHYGNIQLTPQGIRTANRICTQVTLLERFFCCYLGLDAHTAQEDAITCLCSLSPQSNEKLVQLALDSSRDDLPPFQSKGGRISSPTER